MGITNGNSTGPSILYLDSITKIISDQGSEPIVDLKSVGNWKWYTRALKSTYGVNLKVL